MAERTPLELASMRILSAAAILNQQAVHPADVNAAANALDDAIQALQLEPIQRKPKLIAGVLLRTVPG